MGSDVDWLCVHHRHDRLVHGLEVILRSDKLAELLEDVGFPGSDTVQMSMHCLFYPFTAKSCKNSRQRVEVAVAICFLNIDVRRPLEWSLANTYDREPNELCHKRVPLVRMRQDNFRNDKIGHQIETTTNCCQSACLLAATRLSLPPCSVFEIVCPIKHIYLLTRHPVIKDEFFRLDTQKQLSVDHGKVVNENINLEI